MKSISANYEEAQGATAETFADLIFCALIIMVLFVMALFIEVSQRQRSEPDVKKALDASEIEKTMSPKKMAIELAKSQANEARMSAKLVAAGKQQRFTGEREDCLVRIAYDASKSVFYFAPSDAVNEATSNYIGESVSENRERQKLATEFAAKVAVSSRSYSTREIVRVFNAISKYGKVDLYSNVYDVSEIDVSWSHYSPVSDAITGYGVDSDTYEAALRGVSLMIRQRRSKKPHPECNVVVDTDTSTVSIGGVRMSAFDFKVFLLSVSGRGITLNLRGYEGDTPVWLRDRVLRPTGYYNQDIQL